MPNYCHFNMRIAGERENVEELVSIMTEDHPDHTRRLSRVWDVDVMESHEDGTQVIYGTCAWSVYSCMLEGDGTYHQTFNGILSEKMGELRESQGSNDLAVKANYFKRKKELEESYAVTSLLIESKRLKLTIEYFSSEPGMCFEEHGVVDNGNLVLNDTIEMAEYDTEEFDSVEEFNKHYGLSVSQDEFYHNTTVVIGGYEWVYGNY